MTHRKALWTAALLVTLLKAVQFAVDSQVLFYDDSGAFLLNALGYAFIPERSYTYSALIRVFSVSTHSLTAIVAMQVVMGGITAVMLAFILLRFFAVRGWIAILAAVAFALDPVQIVHERLIMAETTAMLTVALFLAAALQYLRTLSWRWLVVVSWLGIVLVSVRIVYLPVVLACAFLLPLGAYFKSPRGRISDLAVALLVSCGSAFLLHVGYRSLTGETRREGTRLSLPNRGFPDLLGHASDQDRGRPGPCGRRSSSGPEPKPVSALRSRFSDATNVGLGRVSGSSAKGL